MKSDLIRTLLEKRGIVDEADQDRFLKPDWDRDTYNPFHMKDMDKAVERVKLAIDNKEKIVIYSDYDCDGIPGGVVLHDFFTKLKYKNFTNVIPHRHNEGYGIHKSRIETFIKDKVSLMITVDLGITNIEEIRYAQENGIDVILTDHHLPIRDIEGKQVLPPAYAVINTKRDDCEYEEKMLCGCATAWKLANAFLMKHRDEYNVPVGFEKWWLDMVGISTIADMVSLRGENRVLAVYGLQVLRKSKRPGLNKIISNARIKQLSMNETDIGFGIAPRLNSAGRMSDPVEAFYALLDNNESVTYAERLEKHNNARKKDTQEANQRVDLSNLKDKDVILIGDASWSPGILGLIASKIVDNTKKTSFVWGIGEDVSIAKGSVRAGEDGANVVQLMSACNDILLHYGGHEQAGGFAVSLNKIDIFRERLELEYKSQSKGYTKNIKDISPELYREAREINEWLYTDLATLSPYGVENAQPIIEISGEIRAKRCFGDKGQHIELNIDGVLCIKFNVSREEKHRLENISSWLGVLERDNYKGGLKIRLL